MHLQLWLNVTAILAASLVGSLQTQDPDPSIVQRASYEFGSSATFEIFVLEDPQPVGASLFINVQGTENTIVEDIELNKANNFSNSVVLDLQRNPIAPFASISYGWLVDFEDGTSIETDLESFIYADNRFRWQNLDNDLVEIFWIEGDRSYGQFALDAASRALESIRRDLASDSTEMVKIFIYPSELDLVAGLRLGGKNLIAGHAISELGVALITASPNPENRAELERRIAHEITHLVLYQAVGEVSTNLPAWLNEGFATANEEVSSFEHSQALVSAYAEGNFLSLASLCQTLPFTGKDLVLAYAESASVVNHIVDRFGISGIQSLIEAYEEGADCEGGVVRAIDLTLEELQVSWYAATFGTQTSDSESEQSRAGPWALLLIPIGLLILFSTVSILRRRREETGPT